MEILKQDQYAPLTVEKQVIVIYAATNGFLDDHGGRRLSALRAGPLAFHRELVIRRSARRSRTKSSSTTSLKAELNKVLDEFKERFAAERKSK